MTNQEFRVKTLGLFAKAEFINENIDFAKAEINLSLQTTTSYQHQYTNTTQKYTTSHLQVQLTMH